MNIQHSSLWFLNEQKPILQLCVCLFACEISLQSLLSLPNNWAHPQNKWQTLPCVTVVL